MTSGGARPTPPPPPLPLAPASSSPPPAPLLGDFAALATAPGQIVAAAASVAARLVVPSGPGLGDRFTPSDRLIEEACGFSAAAAAAAPLPPLLAPHICPATALVTGLPPPPPPPPPPLLHRTVRLLAPIFRCRPGPLPPRSILLSLLSLLLLSILSLPYALGDIAPFRGVSGRRRFTRKPWPLLFHGKHGPSLTQFRNLDQRRQRWRRREGTLCRTFCILARRDLA
ncbi:hypothetical protein VaNZ11_005096 [Volvox africanus]|uniref:Uncharacterized protein n=1 Tax=Volvox africanus TaxID=51714 RepID=A0ABQ5RZM4_9CHLO|nr:hypothetical protein VaNZ11_005096 [Volvox africanus]